MGALRGLSAIDGAVWFDRQVTDWVLRHRVGALDHLFRLVTELGSTQVAVGVMVVIVLVTIVLDRHELALAMVVTNLVLIWTSPLLKGFFERPRPDPDSWLVTVRGSSFPSGHAMNSMGAWGLAAVIAIVLVRNRRVRTMIAVTAVVVVGLVGMSRVYLGVHWSTDVIGGWAIAAVPVAVATSLITSCGDRSARSR